LKIVEREARRFELCPLTPTLSHGWRGRKRKTLSHEWRGEKIYTGTYSNQRQSVISSPPSTPRYKVMIPKIYFIAMDIFFI